MKIAIRANSSTVIGSGHIMRCLVLADALSDIDNNNISNFYSQKLPGNIVSVVDSRGYKTESLDANNKIAQAEFLKILEKQAPDILIIDSYDIDIGLEKEARKYVKLLFVIDDLGNRYHDCDILLDQNPCDRIHQTYEKIIPENSQKLLGLKYALLGKEFVKNKKHTSNDIKNIMIFFGGGDHKNLTLKSLEILKGKFPQYNFHVITGNSNPNKDKIRQECSVEDNFTYYCQINNMAEIMAKCDLFIGAGGTTSWERMCVGLPAIIIAVADNQVESCRVLEALDLIKYLGTAEEFSATKLSSALQWISTNKQWLDQAQEKGQKMVDGIGANKVAQIIQNTYFQIN